MSRTVNSEWLFEERDRELLRGLIWAVADFCGVDVVTYAILSNHFHVLVRVPEYKVVPASEVLRRYKSLYPYPSKYRPEYFSAIAREVESESPKGMRWLEKQRRQMGDVSCYMKILKQLFTVRFNAFHERHGTLWSERFKSVLVEDGRALATITTYIDLNAVRAGLVIDPKDYKYCGYAEAVAGNIKAQSAYCTVVGSSNWSDASGLYRQLLFGVGCKPREGGKAIDSKTFEKIVLEKGNIPMPELLRCRIKYFTDGGVLGSAAFVQVHLDHARQRFGRVKALAPHPLPAIADWGSLTMMRRPRRAVLPHNDLRP